MISAITLLFAISTTIGPANTVKYPEWAVDPVKEKYIPYPLFDAYDASTGGWTSGRITDSLGTAMYASLDAILQRRILPFWYPWGPWRNLTVDAVCSTDFMPDLSAYAANTEALVMRATSPLYFDLSVSQISSAMRGTLPEIDDSLGIYAYATNRDFSAHSRRIYAANAAADYAVTNDMVGLAASFDKSGSSAAHYWMNPASLAGLTSTEFAEAPLPHAGWTTNLFLFVGDYAQTNFFPASLFARDGYAEMRGIHPEWARKYYASKGYADTFDSIFSEDAQRTGGRTTNSVSTLINGGRGVGLIKNVYRRKPTPRIALDRFALLNSAASLCQTAFLGTKTAGADGSNPLFTWGGSLYPTAPVPRFAFTNSTAYHGTLIYTNRLSTTVNFVPSADPTTPENWTAQFDVDAMFAAAQISASDITFKTEDLTVVTAATEKVYAAWHDNTASASLSAATMFDLKRSNFTVTFPTTGLLDNPFADDPDAAKGTWRLDTIVGEKGDVTWSLSPDMIQVDGGWVPDPKAVFADGSTSKQIGQGRLSFKDGMANVPMDFHFTWWLNFNGRGLPKTVAPFVGPTYHDRKTPLDDNDFSWKNTLMSVTYSPELYAAGIVETWIDAYTTVGLSAHHEDVVNLLTLGTLDFTDGIDERTGVFSKYTAAKYRIGSTAGWQGTWMSIYSPSEMESEIDECIDYLKMDITDSGAAIATYHPTLETCLAGYGSAAEAAFTEVKRLLADGADGVYPASFTITPRAYAGIVNGEIPYDWTCGSITLEISIPVTAENARRSSVAVAYEKQGLPFAKFDFPAMSIPSADTADGMSGTAGSTE